METASSWLTLSARHGSCASTKLAAQGFAAKVTRAHSIRRPTPLSHATDAARLFDGRCGVLVASVATCGRRTTRRASSAATWVVSELVTAIVNEDETRCLQMLQANPVGLHVTDEFGMSALHWAAEVGLVNVCSVLLARNDLDVNGKDTGGRTALHLAAAEGHLEICEAILAHPGFTEVSAEDNEGLTALRWAAESGHAQVCEIVFGAADARERVDDVWTTLHFGVLNPRTPPSELR